jgi:hypothetical protein
MSDTSISPEAKFSESFAADYVEQTRVHLNFDQNVVIITEDRLELCLRKHLDCIDSRRAWITPVSLLAAFITTLCSSTFHDWFGLNANTWQALFVLLSIVAAIWSVIAIVRAFKTKSSLRNLLDEIKKRAKVAANSDQSNS